MLRKLIREFYEVLFVMTFATAATILIIISEHNIIQLMIILLVIILTEIGSITRIMNYVGDMIYKKP